MAVDGDSLHLSTAAGDLTLPLLTAERSNVQRANAERANVQGANEGAFEVAAPFAAARSDRQSAVRNPQSVADNPADLLYGTFLGGSGTTCGGGNAVDASGSAYLTGCTESSDFPTTSGAFDTSHNGGADAFMVKLNPAGSTLAYATFLGGSESDLGMAITVDAAVSAYVTGYTESSDFPTTSGVFDTSYNGSYDAFAVKLDSSGSVLTYATFLGGGSSEDGTASIAVDAVGSAYVTGVTQSSDFPTTSGAFDTSYNGSYDAFAVKLDPPGAR